MRFNSLGASLPLETRGYKTKLFQSRFNAAATARHQPTGPTGERLTAFQRSPDTLRLTS